MPEQKEPPTTHTTNVKPTVPDESKPASPRLTPSEIESLQKHKKQVLTSLRGRFAHLFEE